MTAEAAGLQSQLRPQDLLMLLCLRLLFVCDLSKMIDKLRLGVVAPRGSGAVEQPRLGWRGLVLLLMGDRQP